MVKKNPGTNNHHFRRLTKYVILNFVINDNILVLCSWKIIHSFPLPWLKCIYQTVGLQKPFPDENIFPGKILISCIFDSSRNYSIIQFCTFVCLSVCLCVLQKLQKRIQNVSNKLGLSCAKPGSAYALIIYGVNNQI